MEELPDHTQRKEVVCVQMSSISNCGQLFEGLRKEHFKVKSVSLLRKMLMDFKLLLNC